MAAPTSTVQTLQKILANGAPSTDGLKCRKAVSLPLAAIAKARLALAPVLPAAEPSWAKEPLLGEP